MQAVTAVNELSCKLPQLSCYRESSRIVTSFSPELLEDVMTSSLLSTVSESEEGSGEVGDRPWWLGQLELTDLASVDPGRGGVLQKLQEVKVDIVE